MKLYMLISCPTKKTDEKSDTVIVTEYEAAAALVPLSHLKRAKQFAP